MAFDGFVTYGIVKELNEKLSGGKIDKIHQPEKDEIIISIRTREGLFRLLISAATSNPRIHLTNISRENPLTAPLFCMILRKHLGGGKIKAIHQLDFDRVIKIDIECYTELGDLTEKSLMVEIMGKHSNITLIQNDNKIIDSIKHIDFTTSAVRQVLPGLIYELPPKQDKALPTKFSASDFTEKLIATSGDTPLDKFLVAEFMGMSPLLAREIVYRAMGNTKAFISEIDSAIFSAQTEKFFNEFFSTSPCGTVVFDLSTDKPLAFSAIALTQYTNLGKIRQYISLSEAVETFFAVRDMQERLSQKAASTIKLVNNNIERCEKKIALHTESIEKAKNRDKYKMYGDLLTANLYKIDKNAKSTTVQNFFSEDLEDINIPLSEELTPSQNAQRYYKLYAKSKTAEEHSTHQLAEAKTEKAYLETVLDSVTRAQTPVDISEIREELMEQGYISSGNKKKKKQQKKSKPMRFLSSDGFEILIGRNNKQNDELTIKTAYSTDMWLHTKNIPGSHVIIRTNGTGEVPDNTLLEAASLAAYFSKAQKSTGVAVDYTLIKNIRKPNGSSPGFVIFDTNYTVFVDPDEKMVEKLRIEE
ncbi:MAG: NFACT family protein [Clostridia bacterium]|nr:NFACT family protein [Clostridia bacterium]